jgi:hypothetical protein
MKLHDLIETRYRLEANNVKPTSATGNYTFTAHPAMMVTLFNDPEFQNAVTVGGNYTEGVIRLAYGIDIVPSNWTSVQVVTETDSSGRVRYGFIS